MKMKKLGVLTKSMCACPWRRGYLAHILPPISWLGSISLDVYEVVLYSNISSAVRCLPEFNENTSEVLCYYFNEARDLRALVPPQRAQISTRDNSSYCNDKGEIMGSRCLGSRYFLIFGQFFCGLRSCSREMEETLHNILASRYHHQADYPAHEDSQKNLDIKDMRLHPSLACKKKPHQLAKLSWHPKHFPTAHPQISNLPTSSFRTMVSTTPLPLCLQDDIHYIQREKKMNERVYRPE